jgi:chorismate synthase
MNEFGQALRVHIIGSSHGPEVGAEIRGIPAGTPIDLAGVQRDLDRRSPVGRRLATKRQEPDRLVIDTGIEGERATGAPVRAHVANVDARRADYDAIRFVPRPGHADLPARQRFGEAADLSGGGIFSGRMTVGLVIAGGLARSLLTPRGISVAGFTFAIADVVAEVPEDLPLEELARIRDDHETGAPEASAAARMDTVISEARRSGDSVGGIVEVRAQGVPRGLGEPFFDSIESEIAHLAFSIPGIKGVEFGAGFGAARLRGSAHNDPYEVREGRIVPSSNHAGGILGGLATGAPVIVRMAVKPTSSIARPQASVDLRTMQPVELIVPGRHDPCIVPRAVVVGEAVVAFALADLGLRGGFLP